MRVRWTEVAASDLEAIRDYLSIKRPSEAVPTIRRIYNECLALREYSLTGRPGAIPGTRERYVYPLPYLIVYRVFGDAVEVLRIWHTSQNRRSRD